LSRPRDADDRRRPLARDGRAVCLRISAHPGERRHHGGGHTHAWAQVYLRGPGWVDFDPASGIVGNRDLVRVAVVRDPRQAIPLHGTFMGSASDYLGMQVEVVVTSGAAKSQKNGLRKTPRVKSDA
jgi:hypothetical protein